MDGGIEDVRLKSPSHGNVGRHRAYAAGAIAVAMAFAIAIAQRQAHPGIWNFALAGFALLVGSLVALRLLSARDARRSLPFVLAALLAATVVGFLVPSDAVLLAAVLDHPYVFVIVALAWIAKSLSGAPATEELSEGRDLPSRSPHGEKLRRMVVGLGITVVCLAVMSRGCAVSNMWMGSPSDDLAALSRAMDVTIAEAGLKIRSRSAGSAEQGCMSDMGPALRRASGPLVTLDLEGESPQDVSRRIADVWRRHADEWFGGGGNVNDQFVDRERPRVTMYKGGGGLEAQLSYNDDLPFTISAYGPCYL